MSLFDDAGQHIGAWLNHLLTREGSYEARVWFDKWGWDLIGTVLIVSVALLLWRRRGPSTRDTYVRGTRLVSTRGYWFKRWVLSSKTVLLGPARWSPEQHPLHLLVTGAPGTGKSQTIHGVLEPLRARSERAIVADIGGEALRSFGQGGDLLLNPLDARSVKWSPFAEMESAVDADRLAKSMIPDRDDREPEWFTYSQGLVAAVLRRLWENGNATNESLLHALTVATPSEVKLLVSGLPAQSLFHEGAERMLGSVRGIVGSYLAPYSYLSKDAGPTSWSIRRHVREGKTWLWLPYREDHAAALRPLLATWLGEAVNAMLSLPSDLSRRHWLLLDEVASLGRVQGLTDALTKGRKYGVCAVLGVQSIAQLRAVYGDDGAQTLLSCLSSQLFLRSNDPETAEYASTHIGDCELERVSVTRGDGKESTTKSYHIKRVVLASEIQALRNRKGYLRIAGEARVQRVKIPLIKRAARIDAFVPRTPADDAPLPAPPPLIVPSRPPLDADAIIGGRAS